MGSLGTMVYIVAKIIPRIDDTPPKELAFREHWMLQKIERVDKKIKTLFEKFLRRLGVVLLKLENKVNKKVTHLKEESSKETREIFPLENRETPKEEPRPEIPPPPPKRKRKNEGLYS